MAGQSAGFMVTADETREHAVIACRENTNIGGLLVRWRPR